MVMVTTPKYSVKSRKRKREKDCGPGAQSVGHASSEPSTAASLQWPALVTSEMLCFWNKLKLENNKFVQQEDSYMYKASFVRHSWSVKTHLLTMNPLRLVDTYIV